MKRYKLTYIILIIGLLFSFGASEHSIESLEVNEKKASSVYKPGEKVKLSFNLADLKDPQLYITHSYGSSVLMPKINNNQVYFFIPSFISNKIGVINWKLISNAELVKEGSVCIEGSDKVEHIETYLGPIFMQAGQKDFGHLVSIPTDSLDNPVESKTSVKVNQQYFNSNTSSTVLTSNLIAFEEINTHQKAGRISLNSICNGISSKELITVINSANPSDYKIIASTNHLFADGNQLVRLTTSPIKDEYGNEVVDGTFVKFIIKNKYGNLLMANGNTINGIATTRINHPNEEDNWIINSYIDGIAESNSVNLSFKAAIKDFEVVFSDSNRNITIGPIKSYMNQLIPDGFDIQVRVYKNNILTFKLNAQSVDGLANISLNNSDLKHANYDIEIELGGIIKRFNNLSL